MDENIDFSLLNFPDKLWYMVNESKYEQIQWNPDGTSIIIPNNNEFVTKVLNNPSRVLFKTKNFSSFVRQLNLYGFRKVSEHRKVGQTQPVATNRSEFKHPCFIKERKDLLEDVKRQPSTNKKAQSPNEEKPQSTNEFPMPGYGPITSNPSAVGGFWANWDPFMYPFSWMPYGGAARGYAVPSTPQYQGFYGKDGLPYYLPHHTPLTSCAPHSVEFCGVNGHQVDGLANEYIIPHSTSAALSSQSAPSTVNTTSTLSRDTVTGNSYRDSSDVGESVTIRTVGVHRLQEEAKKPIPAQTAEVSTTSNGNHSVKITGQTTSTELHLDDKVTKPNDEKLHGFDLDQRSVIQDYKRLKYMKNIDD